MRERKIPMRRCVGCMTSFPKKDIVRFVATDGKLVIDSTGKLNGRGVYLCRSLECFDTAVKKKRFSHSLDVRMTPEEMADLREKYATKIIDAEVGE